MENLYDSSAPKKATNLSINSDLLAQAREFDINLSATLEQVLQQKLAAQKAKHWQQENVMAIKAYNNFVEGNGLFADEYRQF